MGLLSDIFSPIKKIFTKILDWLDVIPDQPTKETGQTLQFDPNSFHLPIFYGKGRTDVLNSQIAYQNTYDWPEASLPNETLYLVIPLSHGPIKSIGEVYLDGIPITDPRFAKDQNPNEGYYAHARKFLGSESQDAYQWLVDLFPEWTLEHRGRGVAWLFIHLQFVEGLWNGIPKITCDYEGRLITDPNTGFVDAYDNVAAIAYDYVTHHVYGMKWPVQELNVDDFKTGAALCATQVIKDTSSSTLAPLFTFNGQLSTTAKRFDNLRLILSYMRAIPRDVDGKFGFLIEKDDDPVASLDVANGDIMGPITYEKPSKSSRYNRVIVTFLNPEKEYMQDQAVFPETGDPLHDTWLAEDGGELLEKTVAMVNLNSYAHALYFAEIICRRSRAQIQAKMPLHRRWYKLEPGDVISLTGPKFTNKQFRLQEKSVQILPSLKIEVQLIEHQHNIYPWSPRAAQPSSPAVNLIKPWDIPAPSALVFSQITDRQDKQAQIRMNAYARASHHELWIYKNGVYVTNLGSTTSKFEIGELASGNYEAYAASRTRTGHLSPRGGPLAFTIPAPLPVEGVDAVLLSEGAVLRPYVNGRVAHYQFILEYSINDETLSNPTLLGPARDFRVEGVKLTDLIYYRARSIGLNGESGAYVTGQAQPTLDNLPKLWVLRNAEGTIVETRFTVDQPGPDWELGIDVSIDQTLAADWHTGNGPPAPTLGKQGDNYLDLLSGDVYKLTGTGWQVVGNIGGADGDIWHSGNGAPALALGSDGDWYINLSTYDLYQKVAGAWVLQGNIEGPQGVPGDPGRDGVTLYTWIRFADNASGGGISNDPTGKAYIGFSYNQPSPTESNDPADYIWSKVQGEQGDQGIPGDPGENGETYWTWIKYSANADGSGMTDLPQADTVYIGIAINQTVQAESNNPADYTWSQWRGEDGPPGQPGQPGARGNLHLYQATTGTTWNNDEASAAFADFGGVNNADRCTLYNTAAGYSETKGYSDSSGWFTISQVIDGNLLVNGSITADKIDINDLYSRTATISGSLTVGNATSGVTITGGAGSSYIDAKDGGTSVFRVGKTAGTSFISGAYVGAGTLPWAALSQEVIDRIGASVGSGGGGATTGGVRSRSIILAAGTHALTSIESNGQTVTLNAAWGGWTHQRTSAPYSTPTVTLEWLRDGAVIKTKVTTGSFWSVNEGGTTWHYQEMPAINWNESDTTPKASGSTVYSLRVTVSSFTPTGELTFRADQPVAGGGSGGGDWDSITNKPDLIKATAGTYWGLSLPDGTTYDYLRTTSAGLIPFSSGGASTLGTTAWPFNTIYGVNLYENGTLLGNKYLAKAGGTLTGTLTSSVGDGQQILACGLAGSASTGIRRKGSNQGIVLHADDGLMLHSGDTATRDAYITATGIGAGTNEIMHIVSDSDVYISPGQQSGYTTAGRLVVSTSSITWDGKPLYHTGNKPTATDIGLPGLTKPLAGDALTVSTTYGTVEIGMRNSSWCHFYAYTPSNGFYFNKRVDAVDRIGVYGTSTYLLGTAGYINGNAIYHAGNKPTASDVGAVQQGGGTGQGTNKVYIGWNGSALALQVDSSNFGNTWPINITGGAGSAASAGTANKLTTPRTINGVAFDGTSNITISAAPTTHGHTWAELSGIPVYASRWPTAAEAGALASNGTAVAANKLATARKINGVFFDGTTDITVTANPNAHTHNASDINVGTLADARLPTTMSGKSFTSAVSVTGNLTATGVVQGSDVQGTSDIRVKTDLKPITNALSKLRNLNGYTYYRTDIKKVSAGLIAQDLQRVLPEGVSFDGDLLHISQMAPIAILIEAVKELERKVEALH